MITGAGGFVGAHLARALLASGFEVFSSRADILEGNSLADELRDFKPQILVHLAAISHPATCDQDPARAVAVNVSGTERVLDLAARHAPLERVIFASTAQVYAPQVGAEVLLAEDSPLGPINHYAATKLRAEEVVRDFAQAESVQSVIFRIFNHVHRSQPAQTFLSSLYQSMLVAAQGDRRVRVGNLDLYRDIGSIGDLLRAFVTVAGVEIQGWNSVEILNVCNGRGRLLRGLAHILAEKVGGEFEFVLDPSRLRYGEPYRLVGSHALATKKLGWTPQVASDEELIHAFLGEVMSG